MNRTLYLPGTPQIVVRELGERTVYDVPLSEVKALVEVVGFDTPDPDSAQALCG